MINTLMVIVITLVVVLGVQTWRVSESQKFVELLQVEKRSMNEIHTIATKQEVDKQIVIETKWKETYATQVSRLASEAAAARVRSAELGVVADKLRQHIFTLAAASDREASFYSGTSEGSSSASGSGLVLANLYSGVDREAIELAQAFDAAYAAGQACELLHDTVSKER